jgi:hypothetical protein
MVSDDEIGKAGGQPLATTFQEAMERVGPISSSASCYLSEPLRRLTTRVLAPVTAWGLPQCEDDAVHGPNAEDSLEAVNAVAAPRETRSRRNQR